MVPPKADAPYSVTLTFPHVVRGRSMYQVTQVTDSTTFTPGQLLSRSQVDALCADNDWQVKIWPRRVLER